MADPRRYYVDELGTTASPSGDWIKWHDFEDYKAAQRRNKAEATAVKLGLEVVGLKAEVERLRKASFVTAVPAEHYERVVEAADAMRDCVDPDTFPNVIAAYNAAKEGRDAK